MTLARRRSDQKGRSPHPRWTAFFQHGMVIWGCLTRDKFRNPVPTTWARSGALWPRRILTPNSGYKLFTGETKPFQRVGWPWQEQQYKLPMPLLPEIESVSVHTSPLPQVSLHHEILRLFLPSFDDDNLHFCRQRFPIHAFRCSQARGPWCRSALRSPCRARRQRSRLKTEGTSAGCKPRLRRSCTECLHHRRPRFRGSRTWGHPRTLPRLECPGKPQLHPTQWSSHICSGYRRHH